MTTFKASLLVSNIFDPVSKDESTIMKLYETIANLHFYQGIETRIIFDEDIQLEFANLSKKAKWDVTFWLTGNLNQKKLRLCNTTEASRVEAVSYVKQLIDMGYRSNAYAIGICSGQSLDDRDEEYQCFKTSVKEILLYMQIYPDLKLVLEPLDAFADKKHVIGNLETTLKLYEDIKGKQPMPFEFDIDFDFENDYEIETKHLFGHLNEEVRNEDEEEASKLEDTPEETMDEDPADNHEQFISCIDTAHVSLNNDNLFSTIKKLAMYSDRIHFANAVLDKNHPLYGDKHIAIGSPGFLNLNIAKDLAMFAKQFQFASNIVYLTAEVRTYDITDMWETEKETREFITTILSSID